MHRWKCSARSLHIVYRLSVLTIICWQLIEEVGATSTDSKTSGRGECSHQTNTSQDYNNETALKSDSQMGTQNDIIDDTFVQSHRSNSVRSDRNRIVSSGKRETHREFSHSYRKKAVSNDGFLEPSQTLTPKHKNFTRSLRFGNHSRGSNTLFMTVFNATSDIDSLSASSQKNDSSGVPASLVDVLINEGMRDTFKERIKRVRRQTLNLGDDCSADQEPCGDDLDCDSVTNTCKRSVNTNCTVGECIAMAVCDPTSSQCKVKLLENCTSDNECIPGTVCETKCRTDLNGTCAKSGECRSSMRCATNSSTCRIKALFDCTQNDDCIPQAVCENLKCKIKLRNICTNSSECIQGTSCDTGICKANLNSACTSQQGECGTGLECVQSSKLCKIKYLGQCTLRDDCIPGTACDANICKKDVNADCIPGQSECISLLKCDTVKLQCKRMANAECIAGDCLTTAVCQESSSTCQTKVKETCSENNECVQNAICDGLRCKYTLNTDCIIGSQECMTNLSCDTTERKCKRGINNQCATGECTSVAICDQASSSCKIKVLEQCDNDGQCVSLSVCDAGRCKADLKSHCSPTRQECKTGLVCDNTTLTCKVRVMNRCTSSSECVTDAECESGLCRLIINVACTSGQCISNSTCDPNFNLCKVNVLHTCVLDNECIFGGTCEHSICKYVLNVQCTAGLNQCKQGLACDAASGTCKQDIFQRCFPESTECRETLVCDITDNTCKVDVLNECKDEAECVVGAACEDSKCKYTLHRSCGLGECGQGLICDTETKTCRREINSACSRGECVSYAICEGSATCKVDILQQCTDSNQCLKSTVCEDALCKYDLNARCNKDLIQCRTGMVCDAEQGICKYDQNSACSIGKGQCRDSMVCDRVLSVCRLKVEQSCGTGSFCVSGARCQEDTCLCDGIQHFQDRFQCVKALKMSLPWTSNITLPCDNTLSGQLQSLKWHRNGIEVERSTHVSGGHLQDYNLTIWNSTFEDSGLYTCSISDGVTLANASFIDLTITGCLPGFYGKECENLCGNCFDNTPCDDSTGYCRLCRPGWAQPFCQKAEGITVRTIVLAVCLGAPAFLGLCIMLCRCFNKMSEGCRGCENCCACAGILEGVSFQNPFSKAAAESSTSSSTAKPQTWTATMLPASLNTPQRSMGQSGSTSSSY